MNRGRPEAKAARKEYLTKKRAAAAIVKAEEDAARFGLGLGLGLGSGLGLGVRVRVRSAPPQQYSQPKKTRRG